MTKPLDPELTVAEFVHRLDDGIWALERIAEAVEKLVEIAQEPEKEEASDE